MIEENKIHSFRIADLNNFEVWGLKSFSAYQGPKGRQKKTEQVTRYNRKNNPLNTTVNVHTVQCIYNVYGTNMIRCKDWYHKAFDK